MFFNSKKIKRHYRVLCAHNDLYRTQLTCRKMKIDMLVSQQRLGSLDVKLITVERCVEISSIAVFQIRLLLKWT